MSLDAIRALDEDEYEVLREMLSPPPAPAAVVDDDD